MKRIINSISKVLRLPSFLFLSVLSIQTLSAQTPGSLDLTFNPNDTGFGNGDGLRGGNGKNSGSVYASAIQPDGKILIAGSFKYYNGIERNSIARLNMDGSLDLSFVPPLTTELPLIAGGIYSIGLQTDGKIIVSVAGRVLLRLNGDGSIDNSFNGDIDLQAFIPPGTNVLTIAIQTDGKILIGGQLSLYKGIAVNGILRINSDGSIDQTFNVGTGADKEVSAIKLQPDGKILFAGDFDFYNGTEIQGIGRLNTDGTLDTSFNPGAGASGPYTGQSIRTISFQSDGKIIVGGEFVYFDGATILKVARLNQDGSLDFTFNNPGTLGPINNQHYYGVETTAVLPNDKIIIAGGFITYDGNLRKGIARLNADGTHDTSFDPLAALNSEPLIISGTTYATIGGRFMTLALQSDGKIFAGGEFSSFNYTAKTGLLRLEADGALDAGFNAGSDAVAGPNSDSFGCTVLTSRLQQDGKIVIGGSFSSYDGFPRNNIARMNSDGSIDLTFDTGSGVNGPVHAVAVQSDGKIIIGGSFYKVNGVARAGIARLNSDGSLDLTFDPGKGIAGTDPVINAISIQSDGKIVVGGKFSTYNDEFYPNLVRLNTNGTLDNSIVGSSDRIQAIAIQSDGKIIYASTSISNSYFLKRLNSTGEIDATFNAASIGSGSINAIAIQSDGKVVIAGNFLFIGGTNSYKISRLNSDGSRDTGFSPGTTIPSTCELKSVFVQSDNKIVVSGNSHPASNSFKGSARFNFNGTLDTDFTVGSGVPTTSSYITSSFIGVYTTLLLSDGKVLFGGNFTSFNAIGRNRIARVYGVKQAQTITFNPLSSKTFGDNSFSLSASSSSGLPVSFSSSNTSVATISGNTVTIVGAGSTTITASQAGNSTFDAAPDVQQTLSVQKANQTITFNPLPSKIYGDSPFAITATSTSGLSISFASSNTNVATVAGTTITIVGGGLTTIEASQIGNNNYNPASSVDQPFIVTKANQSITFDPITSKTIGDAPFSVNAVATSSLPVQYSTTSNKISITNSQITLLMAGRTNITAGQSGDTNYNPASDVSQSFCINPAKPIITLSNDNTESPTLTSSSSAGNQWFLNGSLISNAVNSTLSVTEPGIYTVTVTVDDCVSEQSTGFPIVITDIPENPQITSLHIYPNPTNRFINIDLTSYKSEPIELMFYQEQGIPVSKTNVIGGKIEQLDIQNYGCGMYFLIARQGKISRITKFIKN